MVGTLADKVSGLLDPRFRLTVWLPTLVFAIALGAVIVLGAGWEHSLAWWRSAGTGGEIALAVLAFAGVTLLAFLLSARLMSFLRLFEGYWYDLPAGEWLAEGRKAHYRARLVALAQADDQATMYYYYPPADTPEHVMPTQLGNVLRAAEVHPSLRYSIDAAIAWPRLYTVLPDSFVTSFAAAKSQMDLMVVWTVLSIAFAILGGAFAAALLPWYAALACAWGGVLSAALSYQALVQNSVPYAELVKSAFDVHRKALLEAVGWTLAPSLAAEQAQWTAITELWYQVAPSNADALGYPGAAAQAPPGPEPAGQPPVGQPIEHLGRWLAVASALLGVLFAGITLIRGATEPSPQIEVPVRALPAYHQIVPSDLKQEAPGAIARNGVFKSLDELSGRYTLHSIAAGQTILSSDVGPRLDPNRLRGMAPVEFGSEGARFPSTLQRGDQVDVFARAHTHSGAGGFEIDSALVLDVGSSPGAIVLAVPTARESALAGAVLNGAVVVMRLNGG